MCLRSPSSTPEQYCSYGCTAPVPPASGGLLHRRQAAAGCGPRSQASRGACGANLAQLGAPQAAWMLACSCDRCPLCNPTGVTAQAPMAWALTLASHLPPSHPSSSPLPPTSTLCSESRDSRGSVGGGADSTGEVGSKGSKGGRKGPTGPRSELAAGCQWLGACSHARVAGVDAMELARPPPARQTSPRPVPHARSLPPQPC